MLRKWVSGFLCLLVLAIRIACDEGDATYASTYEEDAVEKVDNSSQKVVFVVPSKPEDAILALYFTSPGDIKNFVLSAASKNGVDAEISKYDGKWSMEIPSTSALDHDYCLVLKSEGKHHAISVDFGHDYAFDTDEFVVQYEVKFMNGQTCGGAYIKLLSASPDLNLTNFNDKTPYTIMFGPDKCGMTSKLHFIFRHKNPKTDEIQEKHMDQPTMALESIFTDKKTHLFTLVTRSDNSFEVYVDQSLVKSGNLLSDFVPPVVPPPEIDDPEDKKPEMWDDREKIPDPHAKKPDDWDESAPQFIIDEDAVMPEGWLIDTPKLVPDPDAKIPSDWNTETDGEWEPPMVDNPDCQSAPGCGPWHKPNKLNPNYKGKWSPPMISNPKYDGIWKPKKIPNPNYFEDKHPYRMTPIRALGLELWSMSAEIAFDNFYVGTSKKGADSFAADTWVLKNLAEKESAVSGKSVVDAIVEVVSENPWLAATGTAVCFLIIACLLYCCCHSTTKNDGAYHKKTDEPVADSSAEDIGVDADKAADAESREGDDVEDEEQVAAESDEGDGENIGEEQELQEEEKPKPPTVRQRIRKE